MLSGVDLKSALDEYDSKKGAWRRGPLSDSSLMKRLRELYSDVIPTTRSLSIRELQVLNDIRSEAKEGTASYEALNSLQIPDVDTLQDEWVYWNDNAGKCITILRQFLKSCDKKKNLTQYYLHLGDSRPLMRIREFLLRVDSDPNNILKHSQVYEAMCYACESADLPDSNLSEAIKGLKNENLQTQENVVEVLSGTVEPKRIFNAFRDINYLGLLTSENRRMIKKIKYDEYPEGFAKALIELRDNGILSSESP